MQLGRRLRSTVSDVSGTVTTRHQRRPHGDLPLASDIDAHASDGDVTVYGTGEPVALDISTNDGRQTIEGPIDPTSSGHVRIRTSDGDASYLGPRG